MKSIDWRKIKGYFNKRTLMMCAMIGVLVVTGALSLKYTNMAQETAITDTDAQTAQQDQSTAQSTEEQDSAQQASAQQDESTQTAQDQQAASDVGAFFSDYRSERNSVRAQQVAYLDSIIQNSATQQDVLSQAQTQKIELTDRMEKEVTVEGLLRAKGFEQAIVTLSDESVNVVVSDAQLNEAQVAQILEIVQSETGESAQNVKIIPAG
jgi:stage III sporulation protein AH